MDPVCLSNEKKKQPNSIFRLGKTTRASMLQKQTSLFWKKGRREHSRDKRYLRAVYIHKNESDKEHRPSVSFFVSF